LFRGIRVIYSVPTRRSSDLAFMVGRFVATALMGKFKASWLMMVFAIINVVLCGVAMLVPNAMGMIAFASLSFFMSLMFPTIFARSEEHTSELQSREKLVCRL